MLARYFGHLIILKKQTIWLFTLLLYVAMQPVFGQGNSSFEKKIGKQIIRECIQSGEDCEAVTDSIFSVANAELPEEDYIRFILDVSYAYFKASDFDKSFTILKQAEELTEESDYSLNGEISRRFSLLYFYEGNMDTAMILVGRSLELFTEAKDTGKLAKAVLYRGQIQKEKGFYDQALVDYLEAIDLFRQMQDSVNVAIVLGEMATIYAMTDDNPKAIEYGKRAAKIFKDMGNQEHNYAYIALNLANNLSYSGKPDTAIILLNEVIDIFKRDGDLYLQINAIAQLSRAYYEKGEIRQALEIMNEANDLDPEAQYIGQSIYNYQLMGRMYRDISAWPSAIIYYRKSYQLHQQLGLNDELRTLLEDLVVAYDTIQQIDSAYKYLTELELLKDSLYSIDKANKINELKAEYEADFKEEQLRNNAREIDLLEKSNTAKTQRNITLVIILIVVLALTISIISRQRHRIRVNRLLAQESEKTHKAELQVKAAERAQLQEELKHRQKELANQALLIAEKNELLRSFRSEVEKASKEDSSPTGSLKSISRQMERAENQQGDWDKFMALFKDVHPELLGKLAQTNPDLTHNDIRLLALMKMGFSNKEISDILHVTEESLKKARYRLRKKLGLEAQASIHQFIQSI